MRTRNIARAASAGLLALAAAALAGCETTGGGGPMAQAAPPPTHQQAALECWMATEKDAAKLGLDKRADLVTKCIADKMAGKQTASAAPDPKGAAKPQSPKLQSEKPQTAKP